MRARPSAWVRGSVIISAHVTQPAQRAVTACRLLSACAYTARLVKALCVPIIETQTPCPGFRAGCGPGPSGPRRKRRPAATATFVILQPGRRARVSCSGCTVNDVYIIHCIAQATWKTGGRFAGRSAVMPTFAIAPLPEALQTSLVEAGDVSLSFEFFNQPGLPWGHQQHYGGVVQRLLCAARRCATPAAAPACACTPLHACNVPLRMWYQQACLWVVHTVFAQAAGARAPRGRRRRQRNAAPRQQQQQQQRQRAPWWRRRCNQQARQ